MVVTCMPNSGHGGASGSQFMIIFGSYVGRHFPIFNILMYVGVYEGKSNYLEVFGGVGLQFFDIQYFDVCGGI